MTCMVIILELYNIIIYTLTCLFTFSLTTKLVVSQVVERPSPKSPPLNIENKQPYNAVGKVLNNRWTFPEPRFAPKPPICSSFHDSFSRASLNSAIGLAHYLNHVEVLCRRQGQRGRENMEKKKKSEVEKREGCLLVWDIILWIKYMMFLNERGHIIVFLIGKLIKNLNVVIKLL